MINTDKIKELMQEKNITQAMLAERLNIAQATCCQKLNNKRHMSLDEANVISEYLGISPENFGSYFFA